VAPYLDECLASLQRQDCEDYEVLCVNDGSTDNSRDILAQWEERMPQLKVIDRENGGLSAARNSGLAAASGDYVLFMDSDDWVEPTLLERLNSETDGTDLICFACKRTTDGTFDNLIDEQTDGWSYYNHHALEARAVPFVCVWQRCYRREFLRENNLQFREGILHEDNDFTPRVCLKARSVKVIPDVLYHYRLRDGSIMTHRGINNKESLVLIANELSNFFAHESDIDKTTVYRSLTQYYQMAFIDNTPDIDKQLLPLIDWECYHRVSRTKLRHRLQYTAMRLSPSLFRTLNSIL
jgi:glycosyltransferase involved in cell wall biosynthesis